MAVWVGYLKAAQSIVRILERLAKSRATAGEFGGKCITTTVELSAWIDPRLQRFVPHLRCSRLSLLSLPSPYGLG